MKYAPEGLIFGFKTVIKIIHITNWKKFHDNKVVLMNKNNM